MELAVEWERHRLVREEEEEEEEERTRRLDMFYFSLSSRNYEARNLNCCNDRR